MIGSGGIALPVLAALLLSGLSQPVLAAQIPAAAPDPAALTLGFIDNAIAEGRLKSAVELIRRADGRINAAELDLRKGELLLASGALPDAEAAFRRIEADPMVGARAKTGRAVATLSAGRTEEADILFAEALIQDSRLTRAWSARGVLADRKGDWKAAEAFYAQGLAIDPASATLLNNRGYSRLLQGRSAEAEGDFQAALTAQPGLEAAATNLRLARGLQGRYAEAFDGATRENLARDLNTVGVAAMLRGDNRLAQSYFSRAIDMNTRHDQTASANLAYLTHVAPELAETPGVAARK